MNNIKLNLSGLEVFEARKDIKFNDKLDYLPLFMLKGMNYSSMIHTFKDKYSFTEYIIKKFFRTIKNYDYKLNHFINDSSKCNTIIHRNINSILVARGANNILSLDWKGMSNIILDYIDNIVGLNKEVPSNISISGRSYEELFKKCVDTIDYKKFRYFNISSNHNRFMTNYFSLFEDINKDDIFVPLFFLGIKKELITVPYMCNILDKSINPEILKFYVLYNFLDNKSSLFRKIYYENILKPIIDLGIEIVEVHNLDFIYSYIIEPKYKDINDKKEWLSSSLKEFLNFIRTEKKIKEFDLEFRNDWEYNKSNEIIVVKEEDKKVYELV